MVHGDSCTLDHLEDFHSNLSFSFGLVLHSKCSLGSALAKTPRLSAFQFSSPLSTPLLKIFHCFHFWWFGGVRGVDELGRAAIGKPGLAYLPGISPPRRLPRTKPPLKPNVRRRNAILAASALTKSRAPLGARLWVFSIVSRRSSQGPEVPARPGHGAGLTATGR